MSLLDKVKNVYTQYFPPKPTFTAANMPAGSQKGRVFIVTGGNAGIGFELCKILFRTGATIYMGARSVSKAEDAIRDIEQSNPQEGAGQLKILHIDLEDLRSVKDAAQKFARQESRLDVLWNNAGIGPNSVKLGDQTPQGLEPLVGVHCVAPLFFTTLLLPQLRAAASSSSSSPTEAPRVIWLTSGFADTNSPDGGVDFSTLSTGAEDLVTTYAASKAGAWILAREFARRHGKDGIISLPLNPGNVTSGSYRGTGPVVMFLLNAFLLYHARLGACTELYGGLSKDITLEKNGIYIIPWGRMRADQGTVRQDILEASKSEEEGGLGYGAKLWEWCEAHAKKVLV